MKLGRIVTAWKAVNELAKKEMDYQSAAALFSLKRKLRQHMDFYAEKEMEIAQCCGKKKEDGTLDMAGNGRFTLEDGKREEFLHRHRELESVEIEDELKAEIAAPGSISAALLEALDGIITFREEI